MSRAVVLVMSVLCAAVIGGALWLGHAGSAVDVEAAAPGAAADEPAPSLVLPPAPDQTALPLRAEPELESGASLPGPSDASDAAPDAIPVISALLLGRVLAEQDGRAVAGVRVSCRFAPGDGPRPEPRRTLTDEQGRFLMVFEKPVIVADFLVGSGPDTGGARKIEHLVIDVGEQREVVLEVPPGSRVRGVAEDPQGHALAGVQVKAWSRELHLAPDDEVADPPDAVVTTDALGRFAFASLGSQFVLSASAEGRAGLARLGGEVPAGGELSGLRLVLGPALALDGLLLDEAGSPLADAAIACHTGGTKASRYAPEMPAASQISPPVRHATTGADGRFHFDGLPPGMARFVVDLPGWQRLEEEHDPEQGALTLRLSRGSSLAGVVLAADGRALPGALVELRDTRRVATSTGEDGRFLLEGLDPSERARVLVRAPGQAMAVFQPVIVPEGEPGWLEVRLEPESVLAGVVLDADGQPLADAPVSIEGSREVQHDGVLYYPRPTWERAFGLSETHADAQGRFHFGQLYSGEFELLVEHPTLDDVQGKWTVSSGSTGLELVLDPGAASGVRLTGRVTDAVTGAPVTHFNLTPMRPMGTGGMAGSGRHFDDAQGRFTWNGLEPGRFQLDVKASGYATWSRPLREYAEGDETLQVSLLPERDLRLRFVDDQGAPVPAVRMHFDGQDGRRLMVSIGPGSGSTQITGDVSGLVLARGLPAERVTAFASRPGSHAEWDWSEMIDLWSEPAGVRTVVLAGDGPGTDEQATRRLLVALFGVGSDPGIDPFSDDPADGQRLRVLRDAGSAWPLALRASLSVLGSDGSTLDQVDLRPETGADGATRWVVTHLGQPSNSRQDPQVMLDAPTDAVTLLVQVEGRPVRRLAVPPGDRDRPVLLLFPAE